MFARENLTYSAQPLPHRFDWDDSERLERAEAYRRFMAQRHTVRDFAPTPVPRAIIEECVRTAGLAPSGANHQPWRFVAIGDADMKAQVRAAAEEEERAFYAGGAGDEWLKALEPIGTNDSKPHLTTCPWLIVIFAERFGLFDDGTRYKNYYVPESVGIATGFLISALHHAGLTCLTHTPNPMSFLNGLCNQPAHAKPVMIVAVGHPAHDASVPAVAKIKKPLEQILTVFE